MSKHSSSWALNPHKFRSTWQECGVYETELTSSPSCQSDPPGPTSRHSDLLHTAPSKVPSQLTHPTQSRMVSLLVTSCSASPLPCPPGAMGTCCLAPFHTLLPFPISLPTLVISSSKPALSHTATAPSTRHPYSAMPPPHPHGCPALPHTASWHVTVRTIKAATCDGKLHQRLVGFLGRSEHKDARVEAIWPASIRGCWQLFPLK